MAQLPPKAPNMTQNWPDFCNQKMESLAINQSPPPSWVDDFLDFSSAKRSHRRSMSDSIAFLEAPMAEECRRSSFFNNMPGGAGGGNNNNNNGGGGDFIERFVDDEQLMSMFADDDDVGVGPNNVSCSNPSSPSDHDNSINNEDDGKVQLLGTSSSSADHHQTMTTMQPKSEPRHFHDEAGATSEGSTFITNNINKALHEINSDYSSDKIVDPKRIKRILANRQSAQRSRVRKLQYISELERSVSSLQGEVSVLSPRVAFLDHQRLVLNVDNSVLKQRIAALAQDKLFKDAHQEALKREIERLRQIYYQQNLKKMENGGTKSPPRVADHHTNCSADLEQRLAVS